MQNPQIRRSLDATNYRLYVGRPSSIPVAQFLAPRKVVRQLRLRWPRHGPASHYEQCALATVPDDLRAVAGSSIGPLLGGVVHPSNSKVRYLEYCQQDLAVSPPSLLPIYRTTRLEAPCRAGLNFVEDHITTSTIWVPRRWSSRQLKGGYKSREARFARGVACGRSHAAGAGRSEQPGAGSLAHRPAIYARDFAGQADDGAAHPAPLGGEIYTLVDVSRWGNCSGRCLAGTQMQGTARVASWPRKSASPIPPLDQGFDGGSQQDGVHQMGRG